MGGKIYKKRNNVNRLEYYMIENKIKKLAVLIDADNAQAAVCSELLAEIAKFGVANVKRAYGDWTTGNLKGWKDYLHKHAIQPIQQFSYTTGKNSTDSSLIIDAMDLLYAGNLDGFCLISSDSDFTRLATRIRESGLVVYGFGERKATESFTAACDKFIYTEILRQDTTEITPTDVDFTELQKMLLTSIDAVSKDDGWALLAVVGGHIQKNNPSFDPRNYGSQYDKLNKLIKSEEVSNFIEFKEEADRSSKIHIHVRKKSV